MYLGNDCKKDVQGLCMEKLKKKKSLKITDNKLNKLLVMD